MGRANAGHRGRRHRRTGAQAQSAVPALIAALKDQDAQVRVEASLALAAMARAIPALKEALTATSRADGGMGAALAVGHLGGQARDAVADLKKALKDKDARVRGHAAQALWRIDGNAATVLPTLEALLKDSDRNVRLGEGVTLGMIGAAARPAVPALEAALKDSVTEIRLTVVQTLGFVEPQSAAAAVSLAEALKIPETSVRAEGAWLDHRTGHGGERSHSGHPPTPHGQGREPASSGPGRVAAADPGVGTIRALSTALKDENESVRSEAARLLAGPGRPHARH